MCSSNQCNGEQHMNGNNETLGYLYLNACTSFKNFFVHASSHNLEGYEASASYPVRLLEL